MRTIPYDPSRTALYHPDLAPTLLEPGADASDELLCAETARLTYKPFEKRPGAAADVRAALSSAGFTEITFFDQRGCPILAAANPSTATIVVSFRGTTRQIGDVLTDLKTWPALWSTGGWVHSGFSAAFERSRADLSSWLEAHPGRLLITGHSLGGALGTLAATVFKPARLITFGAPRTGNREFAKALTSVEVVRYVGCCDVIARLPPGLFGFSHCGELRYIDRAGVVHVEPSADFINMDRRRGRRDYNATYASRPGAVKLRDFADHAPLNYSYPIQALSVGTDAHG